MRIAPWGFQSTPGMLYPQSPKNHSQGPRSRRSKDETLSGTSCTRLGGRFWRHQFGLYPQNFLDHASKIIGFIEDGSGRRDAMPVRPGHPFEYFYEYRRATIGSIRVALNAGKNVASAVTTTKRNGTYA